MNERDVVPAFTGTHDEQTTARKVMSFPYSLESKRWIQSLGQEKGVTVNAS